MQGVEYSKSNGTIHRDLKPENITLRKENDINSLVLCDFNLSKKVCQILSLKVNEPHYFL